MTKFVFILAILGLFGGCASKEIVVQKCEIPKALLEVPKFSVNRELNTQKDYALLMLDIYESYAKCEANLKAIKKVSDEYRSDN